jgi:quinolinate synthase
MLRTQLPQAPKPSVPGHTRSWTAADLEAEAQRLVASIRQPERWGPAMCRLIAPLTLEINALKREKGALILAHSYQTPDIVYGVADEVGDSYGLSKKAMQATQSTIVFSSVRFMGETAKVLNPGKTVLIPEPTAGCSLSDGITAEDVRALKRKHPGVPVMGYVNTSAAVKAELDVCCTSANYLTIARNLPGKELVFVPDKYMGAHLQKELAGEKTVHVWDGACEVHEQFSAASARAWKEQLSAEGKRLVVLAHPECDPQVLLEADFVGSTEKMMEPRGRWPRGGHAGHRVRHGRPPARREPRPAHPRRLRPLPAHEEDDSGQHPPGPAIAAAGPGRADSCPGPRRGPAEPGAHVRADRSEVRSGRDAGPQDRRTELTEVSRASRLQRPRGDAATGLQTARARAARDEDVPRGGHVAHVAIAEQQRVAAGVQRAVDAGALHHDSAACLERAPDAGTGGKDDIAAGLDGAFDAGTASQQDAARVLDAAFHGGAVGDVQRPRRGRDERRHAGAGRDAVAVRRAARRLGRIEPGTHASQGPRRFLNDA